MRCYLQNLSPGTRFRVAGMPELTGVLVRCSDTSATVRVDGGVREVAFESADSTSRHFRANRSTTTTWAPATLVEPITLDPEENVMSPKKSKSSTAASKRTKPPAAPKAPKNSAASPAPKPKQPARAKPKRLGALDAAAQVLAAAKEPMTTKRMIETMAAQKLWTSPGGKTPHATLYSAILREISTKGKEARFKKTDRGHFAANK